MDMEKLLEALDRIEGKMAETSKTNDAELKRLGEEQVKLARQILDIQQKSIKTNDPKTEVKSVGDQFTSADCFKSLSDGSAMKARVEIKEDTATNPMLTPSVVEAYRRPGVLPGATRPLTIEGLFPSIPVATNAFEYVAESGFVNGAAFVAEGAQKPFGSVDFELKTGTIKTIAHMARVSKQLLADAAALAAYINQRMVYGVDLTVEDELVTGDGTGQHLSGILNAGNYTAHGQSLTTLGTDATLFDLILAAKTQVEASFFRPNVILLNPTNWSKMQMTKNKSGDYYLGHPASVAPKTLWGLPVWTTPAIPADKFLVGDFTQAATLWTRQGMVVEAFEQDVDNVEKNLVTIRAERRLGFGVERATALVGGDLVLA